MVARLYTLIRVEKSDYVRTKYELVVISKPRMMRTIAFMILTLLLVVSCKTKSLLQTTTLNKYAQKQITSGIIGTDPLIIYNGVPIGKMSNLNLSENHFNEEIYRVSTFEKNMSSLIKLFGEDAKEGIVSFEDRLLLYCKKPPPQLFLLDNKEVDYKQFYTVKPTLIKNYSEMSWIKREKDTAYIYSQIYSIIMK